jgi:DNA-binding NtrC family response regulator
LAERREDIDELAAHFCAAAVARHRLPALVLSPGAVRTLRAMEWPGHVRQLEHAVEAAAIRAAGLGAVQIEAQHIVPGDGRPAAATMDERLTFQEATRRFQAEVVRQTLEEQGWNVVETARRLDIARSHLYNLIRGFGLTRGR